MRVAFRADAALHIGTGHVSRCATLAEALRERGAEVSFVCRLFPGHMADWLEVRGFPVHCLPDPGRTPYEPEADGPPHAAWLGVPWNRDARETLDALATDTTPLDWLVVDHYGLDARWERELRSIANRVMVIDDLADRPHDCDLLLDQNPYKTPFRRYERLLPRGCDELLGTAFALFRPEFTQARRTLRRRDGHVRRILVFFGGTDPSQETRKALEALSRTGAANLLVDVVVGATNPYLPEIHESLTLLPNAALAVQVPDMAARIAAADLALGACGAAALERCCLGLPTVTLQTSDHQALLAAALSASGAILLLGNGRDVDVSRLANAIQHVLVSPLRLAAVTAAALALYPDDLDGSSRVAALILGALPD